ncbi:ATP-binding protein [uncultured Deinococcus sp.]|uniref:sensor histidine kinase n=1 Tax=uncultured Deinococcus sp. TaxID=158789 RepID=UPI0025E8F3CB|nr:sensor histidine kinase [uncultured Deinococcus sp.]
MSVSPPSPADPLPAPGRPAGVREWPRGTSLQAVLLRPLILPFVLMLGVGVAVLLGVNHAAQARTLVTDSQTRLILISAMGADIAGMENGERGFVITGDLDFLEPYTEGRLKFAAHTYALRDLSPPAQQERLSQVQALVTRWFTEAAEPEIAARRTSPTQATALVSRGSGRDILNQARAALDVMQLEENTRLSAATTSSQDTLYRVRLVTIAGLGLGVLLLLLTAWQVARSVTGILNHLTDSARQIADGQYHLRLPATGVRELASLGRQVDVMAAAVQQREHALHLVNGRLERSNRELEQFAYVASHDLQEPLRTIGSYTELLARRYTGRLDERADQYIAFTTAATARMKALIQDLLAYSRVRQGERATSPVDTAALVDTVVADLATQVQATGGHIEARGLPVVDASVELLRHVFQNLIGNALKFCAPGRPPHVTVTATRQDTQWVFSVQDNGIGIEPQYHERIFGVFQRLHGMDEYAGSGIGLAVTRSAVEQLGGTLWVDSVPGQGSTFQFSVPVESGMSGAGAAVSPAIHHGAPHGPAAGVKESA